MKGKGTGSASYRTTIAQSLYMFPSNRARRSNPSMFSQDMNPYSTPRSESNASRISTSVRWSGLLFGLALLPYMFWFLTGHGWMNILRMVPIAVLAFLTMFGKNVRVVWTVLAIARVFSLAITAMAVWLCTVYPALIGNSLGIGTAFVCAGYLLGSFCTPLPRKTAEKNMSCETSGDNPVR